MFKNHPRGLPVLFFTEMWERFAYYLMLGIFVLYMTDTERNGLGFDITQANDIYGWFIALVYLTPFVGGIIADLAPILGADVEARASERERAEAAIRAVRDLGKRLNELCGAPTRLRDAGVTEDQLEAIAKVAINDGAVTYNPEEVGYEDALRLLRQAF